MKKYIFGILALFLLVSCEDKLQEVVEASYENGQPQLVRYYRLLDNGDQEIAKEISYYEDGTLRMEGSYKNEKREGLWVVYYNTGVKWSEGYYSNGERHGKGKTYHENGNKYIVGQYTNGEKSGKWEFWTEDGELDKTMVYDQ